MQVGMKKSLFSISVSLHRVLSTVRLSHVINTVALDLGKLVTLVTGGSKWRSLLIAGDRQRSVYDKKASPLCGKQPNRI